MLIRTSLAAASFQVFSISPKLVPSNLDVISLWFMNLELWGLNFKGPLGGVELVVLVAGFKLQGWAFDGFSELLRRGIIILKPILMKEYGFKQFKYWFLY